MKKNLVKGIQATEWLAFKPYKSLSAWYDPYYVKLCNHVFRVLEAYEDWFEDYEYILENRKELACMIVSYFEDFTNEIGTWKALVEINRELYGFCLPFYDLSDYDPDYINQQDIAYLIWHRLAKHYETRTSAPDHEYITDIAEQCFEILEDAIDDAPATDFYEKFFTVKDDENFFTFKERLDWFALSSYALGYEFKTDYEIRSGEFLQKAKNSTYVYELLYVLRNEYSQTKRSSFSALTAGEWMAGVVRASEQKKQEIRDLKFVHQGKYWWIDDSDPVYFTFRHCYTNRDYRVRRDSINEKAKFAKSTDVYNMMLVQWNGDWWLSGVLYNEEWNDKKQTAYKQTPLQNPWIVREELMQKTRETTALMYEVFCETFGSPLMIAYSEAEFKEANRKFWDNYNNRLDAKLPPEKEADYRERRDAFLEASSVLPPEYRKSKDFELFFAKGVGTIVASNVKADIIDRMTADSLTDADARELFEWIAVSTDPSLAQYLVNTYPTKNLVFPIENSQVEVLPNLPFFWRFYFPEEFGPSYPLLTMME